MAGYCGYREAIPNCKQHNSWKVVVFDSTSLEYVSSSCAKCTRREQHNLGRRVGGRDQLKVHKETIDTTVKETMLSSCKTLSQTVRREAVHTRTTTIEQFSYDTLQLPCNVVLHLVTMAPDANWAERLSLTSHTVTHNNVRLLTQEYPPPPPPPLLENECIYSGNCL